jgi:spore coat protein CotF
MQMQQQSGSQQSGSQQSGSQQQSGGKQSGSKQSGGQQSMQMSSQQTKMTQQQPFQPQGNSAGYSKSDKDLCTDMLMTEKYVSGSYDTAIFEFRDPQVRNILNHIQKEEQQHGEAIFNYMENNGMYQVK